MTEKEKLKTEMLCAYIEVQHLSEKVRAYGNEGTADELATYEKSKLNTECTVKLSLDTLSAENAIKGLNSIYTNDELPTLQTMANEDWFNNQIKFR